MSAAMGDPLSDAEVDRLLAPLSAFPVAVLAVSGGPDSMALMQFAAEWRDRLRRAGRAAAMPQISAVTIDHDLRAASAAEAAMVSAAAEKLQLPHHTYVWHGEKPSTGIPAEARSARYARLESYASEQAGDGRAAVVTAHTEDDQAETFLMRLVRGAGIDGLAGMAPQRDMRPGGRVVLVRPLLEVPKHRLIASLKSRGVTWVSDPSNEDDAFERPRLRRLLKDLNEYGVTSNALARSARRVRAAGEAVDYALDAFSATLELSMNDEIFASCARTAFEPGPALLRTRALANLIARFGGSTPAPDLGEIEALAERLANASELTATLGGAVVALGPRRLKVWREAGRIASEPMQLVPGVWQRWDERFWLRADGSALVEVRALGEAGRRQAVDVLLNPDAFPAAALAAQPGFWSGNRLLGVPTLVAHLKPGNPLAGDGCAPHGPFFAKPCAAS